MNLVEIFLMLISFAYLGMLSKIIIDLLVLLQYKN